MVVQQPIGVLKLQPNQVYQTCEI